MKKCLCFFLLFIIILCGCTSKEKTIYGEVKANVTSFHVENMNDEILKVILDSNQDNIPIDYIIISKSDNIAYYHYGEKEQYSIMLSGQNLKITEIKNINTQASSENEFECELDKNCDKKDEKYYFDVLVKTFKKINIELSKYGKVLKV